MKIALVTGAAGFTGRYMVSALAQRGFQVRGLGLGQSSADMDWVACDLTDREETFIAVGEIMPDVVVHLAGMAFVGEGNPEDFYKINVFGTLNLLEALSRNQRKPSRILIASSANVYGNASGHEITEDTCPAPVNHYAASKLAMECMTKTWFDRLPIIITRPFNYTGPGQDDRFVAAKIVRQYKLRPSRIKMGDISVRRDFSDVEDVVEAYARLLESDIQSEIINICSGTTVAISELLDEMSAIAGFSIRVEVDSSLVRSTDIQELAGSNQKLRRLTNFVPSIPIRDTLRRMYLAQPTPAAG